MKRILFFLLPGLIISLASFSQVPNNSFENWTTVGSYIIPDQWDNLNSRTAAADVFTCTKGTPGNPGSAYIKLISRNVSGMGVVPGIAVSGIIDPDSYQPLSGFAFSQRPVALTGNWQYMASGTDKGHIAVYLTKWDEGTGTRDTIANTQYYLPGMVMSWQSFNINMDYLSGDTPDSAVIVLSASGSVPTDGSYLYIDDLVFEIPTAIISLTVIDNFRIYPNPARDYVNIDLNSAGPVNVDLQLVDLSGRVVTQVYEGQLNGPYHYVINTTGMAKGAYLFRIMTEKDTLERKVIIE